MPTFQTILGYVRAKNFLPSRFPLGLMIQCLQISTIAVKKYDGWRDLECFSQNEWLLCNNLAFSASCVKIQGKRQGRWEVDPGPVSEIISGPLQTKFNFSHTQIYGQDFSMHLGSLNYCLIRMQT